MFASTTSEKKGTIIYCSHGGGPLPLLGDANHAAMVEFMEKLPASISKPEAILVISAHWEEKTATLLSAPKPDLLYDYYGFPEESYRITYPAPGTPELVEKIQQLLTQDKRENRLDHERGFDHGLFIPLKLMYPAADIPCTQLSLISGLDPAAHLALGAALTELMSENILVIGSGFSFHNMMGFVWDGSKPRDEANDSFQDWIIATCTDGALSQAEREERLMQWDKAPGAHYCHPREEHLLPLHVCAGMAGKDAVAKTIFDDYILGKRAVALQW
ncbi:MAG: class III extradiol ring-cleavage dioxygenase [Candidatus Electrothrix scaldis]|nr:MAG: class III extradiol ring-cleavage dioxygenase [Candidatus Electrothrix sp. GW3-3]